MGYDIQKLNGEFVKRSGRLPEGALSAMDLKDNVLEIINNDFDALEKLGIKLGENGKVPESEGIPRIFIMQPDKNGIDSMKSLDAAGLSYGSREFWKEAQLGNIFAFPSGSEKPVQVNAEIFPDKRPKVSISAPLDMEDEKTVPESHNYRKPGLFTRILNKLIPNYRKKDCEIYNSRLKFAEAASKRAKGMKQELEELKAEEAKRAAIDEQKALEKDAASKRTKASAKTLGKQFYKDLVFPTPVFHPEYAAGKGAHYKEEQFKELEVIDKKFGDYSVGGKAVSEDEYCGLVIACSHDAKNAMKVYELTTGYDATLLPTIMGMGYSEKKALEFIATGASTFFVEDQMKADLRANQGEHLKTAINPGRKQVFDILEEYKKGNKEPLAEKIAFEVRNVSAGSSTINATVSEGGRNHYEFSAALTDLMDRDPALKKLAMDKGLRETDIKAAKGLRNYAKAVGAREDAMYEMAKAVAEGRELSPEDKKRYARSIMKANLMESKIFVNYYESAKEGFPVDKKIEELQNDSVKNGLVLSAEKLAKYTEDPRSRTLPPKGKCYMDQVTKIVDGMRADLNIHPDPILEIGDQENLDYYDELIDGVIEKNGLADQPVKDLYKAISKGDNIFAGVRLVEETGKIAEQKRLQELGLEEFMDQKELEPDPLNTAVDYGRRGPKAGPDQTKELVK